MKAGHLFVVLLFCLVCTLSGNAQSDSSASHSKEQANMRMSPPLQLTMRIIKQAYCKGDSDLDGLRLNVLFDYTNIGEGPLILYKGSNLVSRIMVSRNLDDAAARRFELNASVTQLTAGGGECFEGILPNKCFFILAPGTSYRVKAFVGIFAVRDDAKQIQGGITSGEHVLQVEVSTWPESNDLAKQLSDLWHRSGRLWYEPITTSPVSLTVGKRRKVADCP